MSSETHFTAACLQMNAGPVIADNLAIAESLIREAAGKGADYILTPENTCHIRFPATAKRESAADENTHPALPLFCRLAEELGVWIHIGSLGIRLSGTRMVNRAYLITPRGDIAARYDKIHLFDVDLPTGERHRESDLFEAGTRRVTSPLPWGILGFSICYDLRFPSLYRSLAQAGAVFLAVPAAFTVPTGRAHWEILLRARAIETGSFVFAAAQTGTHEGGRQTWGHSMIIDPWGDILAKMESETGFITARITPEDSAKCRAAIPCLAYREATEKM